MYIDLTPTLAREAVYGRTLVQEGKNPLLSRK